MIAGPFSRLWRDKRGASVIELAIVAPMMAALVIGMVDLARAYSMRLQLEQAAQRTIEKVEQQKSVGTNYNTLLSAEALSAATAAGYSTGNTITPDAWVECSTNGSTWTRQTNFTDSCPNATDITARYVSVSIANSYTPVFPSRAWPGANSNGSLTMTGFAALRMQ